MRKIINSSDNFVDEVIDGILLAHPRQLRAASTDHRALVRTDAGTGGRVGIVTGGGSGHLPLFLGYVGKGLASGVAVGNVFSSPSAEQIYTATRASDDGAGVLYLYGNYGGDIYNFDIAADLALADGIKTTTVLGADDIVSAPFDKRETRRGVAGLFFAYKTAGAAAERGDDLETVTEIAQRTCDRVRTMGVGLSPTILPAAGEPTFELADGEMEIGIGIHGEPGSHRGPLESADEITDRFLTEILSELDLGKGDKVAILVNGLGATPLEELYLIYRRAHHTLVERGVEIAEVYIGEYATSLEMAGASLSILHLDEQLQELLRAPASSPFYQNAAGVVDDAESAVGDREVEQGTTTVAKEREIATVENPGMLREVTLKALEMLPQHASELRELDAALGDGDLGITVSKGSEAAAAAVAKLPENAAPSEILSAAGAAFAGANPSTFAALTGGGLLAASQAIDDAKPVTPGVLGDTLLVMVTRIQERGGAQLGDKTMVDVLHAVGTDLAAESRTDAGAAVARDIAKRAHEIVNEGEQSQSQRGRAAWVGERSIGHKDPGQVAFTKLFDAIAEVLAN